MNYEDAKVELEKWQAKLADYAGSEAEALKKDIEILKGRIEYSKRLESQYLAELKAVRGKGTAAYRQVREKYAAKGVPVQEITFREE